MITNNKTLGEFLRKKREEKNISYDDVFDAIKLKPQVIKDFEDGKNNVLGETAYDEMFLKKYINFLNIDIAEINKIIDNDTKKERGKENKENLKKNSKTKEEIKIIPKDLILNGETKVKKESNFIEKYSIYILILILITLISLSVIKNKKKEDNSIAVSDSVEIENQEETGNKFLANFQDLDIKNRKKITFDNDQNIYFNDSLNKPGNSSISTKEKLTLSIDFQEICWVEVKKDTLDKEYKLISKPEQRIWVADDSIIIYLGNLKGIKAKLNNYDITLNSKVSKIDKEYLNNLRKQ